jgi:hypothetical protein
LDPPADPSLAAAKLESVEEIRVYLSWLINMVCQGRIDPKQATVIGKLVELKLDVLRPTGLAEEIAELRLEIDQLAATRRLNGQVYRQRAAGGQSTADGHDQAADGPGQAAEGHGDADGGDGVQPLFDGPADRN